ncbi:MAG: ABC-2 type transport system permease [Erysipelotrichaceae bacterium]|nr:MAG: ABC-2 type transport system permease [Erysipelotrichaceae bacterium]
MNTIKALTIRNLKLFFRDKALVFFSFLSVMIILGLYVLFLGDINVANIKSLVGQDLPGIEALVYGWMLPGVIAISTVTLALGNMGRLVDDARDESLYDFMVSPMSRAQLIISYVLSTILIAALISGLMFIASIFIVKFKGGSYLTLDQILSASGIILLLIISSSLMSLLIASFVQSPNTYGVVNSIGGTFIGFVTGAYMPMGIMPVVIQNIFNSLPVSQGASILRQIFLRDIIKDVFMGAPESVVADYRYFQGIDLKILGHILTLNEMMISIFVGIILLFLLSVLRFKNLTKKV